MTRSIEELDAGKLIRLEGSQNNPDKWHFTLFSQPSGLSRIQADEPLERTNNHAPEMAQLKSGKQQRAGATSGGGRPTISRAAADLRLPASRRTIAATCVRFVPDRWPQYSSRLSAVELNWTGHQLCVWLGAS